MNSNFAIVVDSTTDLPHELADKLGVVAIPYIFTLDGKEYLNYLDYREISVADFYNTLRSGKMATTAQVTSFRYMETWEPFLKDGKDVLYMCLSSTLSKSYDQSMLAAQEAREAYPERTIITIDTKSASMGQGLLAYYASKARDEGKTIEEVAAYVEDMITKINHWVMVDELSHLRRGGRLSGAAAVFGTMLSVKPLLTITDDGKLVPASKVRGRSKAIDYMVERMNKNFANKDGTVAIVHGDAPEFAQQLKGAITAKFGEINCIVTNIGPVIGAHTGPGTLAVMYLGDKRPVLGGGD